MRRDELTRRKESPAMGRARNVGVVQNEHGENPMHGEDNTDHDPSIDGSGAVVEPGGGACVKKSSENL